MPLRALAPLLMAVIAIALPARGADEKVWLELRAPESGAVVIGPIGVLEVAGWAGTSSEDRHDLIIAIDISESTGLPSGTDVNGNGRIGRTRRSARDPRAIGILTVDAPIQVIRFWQRRSPVHAG